MEIEELRELLDVENIGKFETKEIELLLNAITDWPKPIKTLLEFLTAIKKDLKVEAVTYTTINDKLATLDPASDAWKIESLTAISELIRMSNFKTLNEIVAYYQNMKYAPQ